MAQAGVLGFVGNEWVAQHRIRVGRRIGSAALLADGLHARTNGCTSLAVVLGAGGVALGVPAADPVIDPVIGPVIAVAIVVVLRTAARDVFRRLVDGVDPALVATAEEALRAHQGVLGVAGVRMRWVGHRWEAEAELVIDAATSPTDAHDLAHDAEHAVSRAVPELDRVLVHAHPHRTTKTSERSRRGRSVERMMSAGRRWRGAAGGGRRRGGSRRGWGKALRTAVLVAPHPPVHRLTRALDAAATSVIVRSWSGPLDRLVPPLAR